MAANQFEQLARARKVRRLVAHFDQWIKQAGHDPLTDAQMVADAIHRMTDPIWTQHLVVCGYNPKRKPSRETRNEVIAVYLDRAGADILAGIAS